jgi:hypothetical protein
VRCAVTSTYLHPASGFNHHEQIARAFAFVLIIHALGLPWLNGNRRVDIGVQHHRLLIQADSGILRVILLLIEVQHVFHGGYTFPSD